MQQASSSTFPASCPEADPFKIKGDSNSVGFAFDLPCVSLCGSSFEVVGDFNASGLAFDLPREPP